MLAGYFKIIRKNLVRNKLNSFINIGGLSLAICICLLIMLYVSNELSFDKFHARASRTYYLNARIKLGTDTVPYSLLSYQTGPLIKEASAAVENFLRIYRPFRNPIISRTSDDQKFLENQFIFADSNFFNFFSFPLTDGNPKTVLRRPFTAVITHGAALKYFGHESPIGKSIRYNHEYDFEITGVSKDPPSNSSIQYDFVASLTSKLSMQGKEFIINQEGLTYGDFQTFLTLKDRSGEPQAGKAIQAISDRQNHSSTTPGRYFLSPLTSRHFDPNIANSGSTDYLDILPVTAALIMILAIINYISLTTAGADLRAKEIGVRKVSGASRADIIKQFYFESACYVALAFVIGLVSMLLLQDHLFGLLGIKIDRSVIFNALTLKIFGGILILTVLLSGCYPSLVLSSYRPILVLNGRKRAYKGGSVTRTILTILQFSVSTILVICCVAINRQLYFIRHLNTGIDRDNVVMIPFQQSDHFDYYALKNDLRSISGIKNLSTADFPLYKDYLSLEVTPENETKSISIPILTVDGNFISAMDMQWKFPPAKNRYLADAKMVAVNVAAINKLHLRQDPRGLELKIGGERYQVTGVLADFNFTSLHFAAEPVAIIIKNEDKDYWGRKQSGCLFIKIGKQINVSSLMNSIQTIYEKYEKKDPFQFEFMNTAFNSLYRSEERLSLLLNVLTILIISIACLGLFGLTSFSTNYRKKEVSIRKALGASLQGIVRLLLYKFLGFVLCAVVIALPVAWYLSNLWLQNFAYKEQLNVLLFILPAAGTILLALLSVIFLVIKVASVNPAQTLKSE